MLQLAIGQILVWAGLYYVFPALLLRWELSLGWSKTTLTGAISLAIIVSGLTAPLAGRLIDTGRGATMMAGAALSGSVALIGLSFVTEPWQFYVVCAVIGLSLAGCLYEPSFSIVTRARGDKARATIIAITLIAGFASSLSFPAAHAIAEAFDWRITLRVFALVVIFVGAPLLWRGASRFNAEYESNQSAADTTQRDVERLTASRWSFIATPSFFLVAIGFALMAVVHGVTLHHLLSLLNERQINPEVSVIAASFIGPMQVAGRLALFAAGSNVSNHHITIGCFSLMATSIMLLMGAGFSPALLPLFVILFGSSYGLVSIVRPLIARDLLGQENIGAKFGALALFYLLGSGTAPFIGSLIWNVGGYDLVLPCLIAFAGFGLLLYVFASRLSKRN